MAGIDGGGAAPSTSGGIALSPSTRLVLDLIYDVLPRLGTAKSGITIYSAVNAITSIIYRTLLERNSDLIATGDYQAILPAGAVSLPLPEYFTAFAERPRLSKGEGMVSALTDVLTTAGVSELGMAAIAGLLASGCLISDLQTVAETDVPGIDLKGMVAALVNRSQPMEPTFLDDDHGHDHSWYSWYAQSGYQGGHEQRYKVVNDTIYVRPRQEADSLVSARYFQAPSTVSLPSDVLQYSPLSYEVYKEGVVMIIVKGLAIPEADMMFIGLIEREIMRVVNARARILPQKRMTRRNWI